MFETEIIYIAVLMTCYNRKEKTMACLRCVFENILPENIILEIFLVDDLSTDGTHELVHANYPNVNIIKGTGQLFWNRGMHCAWINALKKRNYNYYLWLNDDTYIHHNAIHILLNAIQEKNNDGIVGGFLQSIYEDRITYGGINKDGKMLEPNGNIQDCFELNGNCVLVPDKIVKTVGIIDPIYPHAFGDFDYSHRVRKVGFHCWLSSCVIGNCDANKELPIWCNSNYSLFKRLKNLYTPKAYSHPYYQFQFEKKHYNLIIAAKHFFSIHFRALFPGLWTNHF